MVSIFRKKINRKEKFSSNIFWTAAFFLLFFSIYFLFSATLRVYHKKKEMSFQINKYKEEIERTQRDIDSLKEKTTQLKNIEFLEKIAYEELGQQKPEEKSVVFIIPPSLLAELSEEKKQEQKDRFWIEWFKKIKEKWGKWLREKF